MTIENKAPGKDVSSEDLLNKFPLASIHSELSNHRVCCAGVEFGGDVIPIFAGPNTVENRDMIVQCARQVKDRGASFLRGGAYKPLSFPYRGPKYFELREEGLEYLAEAKSAANIPVITEVMHEKKVSLVAEVADILQIGTRNMQNYALLEEVAAMGKPVMLKRHYGASLRDWLGAAEYLLFGGCRDVILCERGVSAPHTHRASSRFLLDLQVIPAAKELTWLPIVTDPSHATFWHPWVKSMTMASVASGADGVMLEVHPQPRDAAVDPLQAIGFDEFSELVTGSDSVARALGRRVLP